MDSRSNQGNKLTESDELDQGVATNDNAETEAKAEVKTETKTEANVKVLYVKNDAFEAYVINGVGFYAIAAVNHMIGCSDLVTGLAVAIGVIDWAKGASNNDWKNTQAYVAETVDSVATRACDLASRVKENESARYYYSAATNNASLLFNGGLTRLRNLAGRAQPDQAPSEPARNSLSK